MSLLHVTQRYASNFKFSTTMAELFASIMQIAHISEAMLVLMTISFALRMYVRLKITRQFNLGDWAMVLTFFLAVSQSALTIASSYLAIGLWTQKATADAYSWTERAAGMAYVMTLSVLKISLGFFFLNIFLHRKLQSYLIYAVMILSFLLGMAYWPVGFITCAEIKADLGYVSNCPTRIQRAADALFDAFSLVNILGDFIFVGMSVSAIWEAKLSVMSKLSASTLLLVACSGAVASTIRFVLVVEPTDPKTATQDLIDIFKWCIVEVGVCFIAANLVMLRPLFRQIMIRAGLMTEVQTTNPHGTVGSSRRVYGGGSRMSRTAGSVSHDASDVTSRTESKANMPMFTVFDDEEKNITATTTITIT